VTWRATTEDTEGHSLEILDFLKGIVVPSVPIDTSEPATDTIDYVATDTWGNNSTSTRTVVIEPHVSFDMSANEASSTVH
jgi:hypothetical protein